MTPTQKRALALTLATAIAIPAEGLRRVAYQDPPGIWTICYGTTNGVKKGDIRTLQECRAYLNRDMNDAINTVEHCHPGLPVNVLAAFSDAVYNLGPAIACDTSRSTAARLLKAGDIKGACGQLLRWNKARVAGVHIALPGLTKRRERERELCMMP